jgi:sugar lactone lactonase YvrE
MNENRDADTGALYRLDNDLALTRLFGQMTISNGLAFSPDGTTMYHADTPTRTVRAFDYAADASLPANPRVFAQWEEAVDRPDGAAVDSAGNYWVAHYHAGHIVQLSATGKEIATYPIPAMCPTMCAFGGDDLRTLYVTTARQLRDDAELARFPQSGSIFSMRVDVPGLPEPRFRG